MKIHQKKISEIGLFFGCFVVLFVGLYKSVYTENGLDFGTGLILISEIRPSGGAGKPNDEFIELYNPKPQPVVIGGWVISKMTKSASSTDRQQLFLFPLGAVIPGQAHLLVAHAESSVNGLADFLYSGQVLSDDNSVALADDLGNIVDLVGYGLAKNKETEVADPPNAQLLSIERKPGAALGNHFDTNNNKLDFFRTQSSPQNLQSGLVTSTLLATQNLVTSSDSIIIKEDVLVVSSTNQVTVSSTELSTIPVMNTSSDVVVLEPAAIFTNPHYLLGSVLISELYPIPRSGETEYVELFNRTPQEIDLTGWYLGDGGGYKTPLLGSLASLSYLVIEKPKGSLNNTGDQVNLFAPNETVIDQVSYGGWNDGAPGNNALTPQAGSSIVRIYDDQDSNMDYFDFGLSSTSTKGFSNIYLPIIDKKEPATQQGGEAVIEDSVTVSTQETLSAVPSTKQITKKNEPLYIRIGYPAVVMTGDEIFLDASLSSGGEGTRKYLWEMDDGNILSGDLIKHIYHNPDVYSVSITAFDNSGAEKHKTIKIKVLPNPTVEPEKIETEGRLVATTPPKNSSKKIETVPVFTQINELGKTKTNSLVRIRGVLAAVFMTKTGPEFYVVGESPAGGSAVGTLVKAKNNTIDARIGDKIEITGKNIINLTSGNYLQYLVNDQISVISSNEVITPLNSSIKNSKQLDGGYLQIEGAVVEKKSSYLVVADETGEIKVTGDLPSEIKINDQLLLVGYLIHPKDGAVLKISSPTDIAVKDTATTTKKLVTSNTSLKFKKSFATYSLIGFIISLFFIFKAKKLWLTKSSLEEATEN